MMSKLPTIRRILTQAACAASLLAAALLLTACDDSTYTAPEPVKGKMMSSDADALAARQAKLAKVSAELDRRITYTIAAARQRLREEADVVRRDLAQAAAGNDVPLKNELRDVSRLLVSLDLEQAAAAAVQKHIANQTEAVEAVLKSEAAHEAIIATLKETDAALKAADELLAIEIDPKASAQVVTEEAIDAKVVEIARAPLPAVTVADARKRRDEWRAAKNAKAVKNDPPGTVYTDPNTGNPTLDPEKAIGLKVDPPKTPADFVDPDNPDLKPADRTTAEKFDHTKAPVIDGAIHVPFATLSGYTYASMIGVKEEPDADKSKQDPNRVIPQPIKAINGKQVVIEGYMMPIDFEDGGTNEFILTRVIPSCFYCQPMQLNDWIEVKMAGGKRVPYVPDAPIRVFGTIKVGEVYEDGFIVCLYQITGTKVDKAPTP
ncbi:MAG: DUF3299 domain-containing protein [Phycisphaeraceae bacterium]